MADGKKLIEALTSGSIKECEEVLADFNTKNEKARMIDWMTAEEKVKLWTEIFTRLGDPDKNADLVCPLLNALRILSREKEILEAVMTKDLVICVLNCTRLKPESRAAGDFKAGSKERLNGLKVIFNMVFQSEKLQSLFVSNGLLGYLVKLVDPRDESPLDVQYFLLKTFFIITALSKGSGAIVRNDLNGIEVLLKYIDVMGESVTPYDSITADVICEALKVLYNIIHDIFPNKTDLRADMFDSKTFTLLCQMCKLVRRNLLHDTVTSEKKVEIDCHSIHLLTAVPEECYDELFMDVSEDPDRKEPIIFENKILDAIETIVNLLSVKLDSVDRAPAEPILLVLFKMASKNRIIRKYLKHRILPPLTRQDVMERPETGTSIRNKLCSLIHTPTGYATDVTANLLFVLCKENVRKLVKYTGYGNAAGLLANRGLMLGGKGDGMYSDDSEDSDTEEYSGIKDQINSVEGWIKPEAPPLEMTEEQKEVEAMKLVETISKMTICKAIQPCRIGADGKPQPIEHVIELQEALENPIKQMSRAAGSDSDSDSDK